MLVLSRKRNESIVIGEDPRVTITVVEIRGDKVRLGVKADRSIAVHRGEVRRAIDRMQARDEAERAKDAAANVADSDPPAAS